MPEKGRLGLTSDLHAGTHTHTHAHTQRHVHPQAYRHSHSHTENVTVPGRLSNIITLISFSIFFIAVERGNGQRYCSFAIIYIITSGIFTIILWDLIFLSSFICFEHFGERGSGGSDNRRSVFCLAGLF